VDSRDLKNAYRSATSDRTRRPAGPGADRHWVFDEFVDLLPKVMLFAGRADPGPPQKPPEVTGHDERAHQTEGAERTQNPAGANGLWRFGLGAEDRCA